MTKSEAREQGQAAGQHSIEIVDDKNFFRTSTDDAVLIARNHAATAAYKARGGDSPLAESLRAVFIQHYVSAFMNRFNERSMELPDVAAARDLESFQWAVRSMVSGAQEKIDKFILRMQVNPSDAFSWSNEAMDAAARLEVAARIKHGFDSGMSLDDIRKELRNQVLRGAKFPSSSTSMPTNLMAQYVLAATASLVD